jgi:hypothetical protein
MSRIASPLVIVDNLNVISIAGAPSETDAPLVVDPDAVLAGSIAFQRFEPIARRDAQEIQSRRSIDLQQFSMRNSLHVGRKASAMLAQEEPFRLPVRKALDHRARPSIVSIVLLSRTNSVK